jgi:hypothetical protein
MTDEQIHQAALEDWLGVLAELWTAVGKPLDAERLKVYQKSLETIPLGLLELAVLRAIRENTYQLVPPPGALWAALRKELGDPQDVHAAIEAWCEERWGKIQWLRYRNDLP